MPLLLSAFIIWFLLFYQKKKFYQKIEKQKLELREKSLLLDKQLAIQNERNRIASEMHDDLGSGLTTIKYLSERALKQAKDPEEEKQVKRIADHSSQLVRNMSEIIWAMNTRYDTLENLIAYIRRYASEYLEEHQISFEFFSSEIPGQKSISGERRRNLFLVVKEILHNAVKYSKAKKIELHFNYEDDFTIEFIEKEGIGFDPALVLEKGNGIYNIQKRMDQIEAKIQYQKEEDGMHIRLSYKPENSIA